MKIINAVTGEKIIVDDDDFAMLKKMRWHIQHRGYRQFAMTLLYENGIADYHRMEKLILNPSKHDKIWHKSNNSLDNRRCNLDHKIAEIVDPHKAPWLYTRNGNWHARIKTYGKTYLLGSYDTEQEASEAYQYAVETGDYKFENNEKLRQRWKNNV